MSRNALRSIVPLIALGLALAISPAAAQVGKGLIDLNSAPETELAALPNVTPALVKGLLEKRPFATIVDANTYLMSQSLTADQLTEIYRRHSSM